MTVELTLALVAFCFVSSITPGPNNLMLLSSGVNFGVRRSVPHMLGIGIGFCFMILVVGLGVAELFERFPAADIFLKVVSVIYLLYLAWKIAWAGAPGRSGHTDRPFSFMQAALFQWVNPKAWAMALTALNVYAPSQNFEVVLLVALIFGLVNLPSVSVWVFLGQSLRHWLEKPRHLQIFNFSMAGLLILSLYPLIV